MRSIWLTGVCLICLALNAPATTYVVHPDGTGDYPTVQAAINHASSGDIIELSDGVFYGTGNRDVDFLDRDLTLRSQGGGPEQCIIHCDGTPETPHRAFYIGYQNSSVIEGVTIEAGYTDETPLGQGGGGVYCWFSSPTFTNCIIRNCSAASEGGGVYCNHSTAHFIGCVFTENEVPHDGAGLCALDSHITLDNTTFEANQAWGGAGIYSFGTGSLSMDACELYNNNCSASGGGLSTSGVEFIEIRNCAFIDNTCGAHGGALALHGIEAEEVTIEGCTLIGNVSSSYGGAIYTSIQSGPRLISGCTLYGNTAPEGAGICFRLPDAQSRIENTIVAFSTSGTGVRADDGMQVSCSDFFGNPGGDWIGPIAHLYGVDGNISENPLFCGPEAGDFQLGSDSPCRPFSPPNEECDLIGAWPVGCGPTPAASASWGRIKTLYRTQMH